jgi:hypothetical protein
LVGGKITVENIGVKSTPSNADIVQKGRLGPEGVDFIFSRVEGILKVARNQTMTDFDVQQ